MFRNDRLSFFMNVFVMNTVGMVTLTKMNIFAKKKKKDTKCEIQKKKNLCAKENIKNVINCEDICYKL